MTPDEITELEETIAASFIRGNVLSIQDAKDHAALAVTHMKNAMALASARKGGSV
jgi:hypothetical protein